MGNISRGARNVLLVLLLLGASLFLIDLLRAPLMPEGFAQQVLHTIDGKNITLAQLSEKKPLLVYFWASWCGACRYTTPYVEQISDKGGNVLAIALGSGNDIHVVRVLHGKHLTMPVVNDPAEELASSWAVSATPTLLIVSKGKVVNTTTGWTSEWGIRLRLWWAQKWFR